MKPENGFFLTLLFLLPFVDRYKIKNSDVNHDVTGKGIQGKQTWLRQIELNGGHGKSTKY